MDFEAVAVAASEAIEAMLTNSGNFFVEQWPHDGCDVGSLVVGRVLLDRGLGDWWIVTARTPNGDRAHTWLEWRGDDGRVLFTIDASIHQFDGYEEPYCGEGPNPLAERFSVTRRSVRMTDRIIFENGPVYADALEWTRRVLREASESS